MTRQKYQSVTHQDQKTTIYHLKHLDNKEYLRVADLKIAGHSCETCIHAKAQRYVKVCAAQRNKIIRRYNICHLHTLKEITND